MSIFQVLLFISLLSIINAQWFIRRPNQTKKANYPNPGKRSISEDENTLIQLHCSKPYSQLQTYQEKFMWIFTCLYSNTNTFNLESSPKPTYIQPSDDDASYITKKKDSMNNFLVNLLRDRRR